MVRKPILIPINPECLIEIRPSDLRMDSTKENPCCERIKQADYIILSALGIARMNLNFCPCCGKRLIRNSTTPTPPYQGGE